MQTIKIHSSKGILFLGDLHVDFNSIKECEDIANEIAFSGKADILIQLGDICDKNKLSSHELDSLTSMVNNWTKVFKEVHILEGNHDKLDKNYSIIMYLKHLGIHIHDDDILFETNLGKIRCGHYFIDKSYSSFGHFRMTLAEFKQDYQYGFLGHQHDYQRLEDNFHHLGSSRFVSFGEKKINESASKKYSVIDSKGLQFFNLNSTIPMYDVSSLDELTNLPKMAKVRYVFNSFEQLKNDLDTVNNEKNLYYLLQKKLNFSNVNLKEIKTEETKTKDIIRQFLKDIDDPDVKRLLTEEFKKEYA